MIFHEIGDLLKSDCTVIAHQANCMKAMGAGIAYQIKLKYPKMYEVDCNDPRSASEKLGGFTYARIQNGWGFNLYGQFRMGYGLQTDYKALEKAIDKMLTIIPELTRFDSGPAGHTLKVGMPWKIGAGLAGGDWDIILNIIETLSYKHNIDIYLYELKIPHK
jgi:O-acetyl-ADP-ribose deacetylase (regulator of RNase III)